MPYHLSAFLWRKDAVAGGAPCLRGTAILVSIVVDRYAAGDSVHELAIDYGWHPSWTQCTSTK